MKVFLLTTGEYSDYRVYGVFTKLEILEQAKVSYWTSAHLWNDVEEFELDFAPETPPGLTPYRLTMKRDGTMFEWSSGSGVSKVVLSSDAYTVHNIPVVLSPHGVEFHVFAEDEKHAIKIANEKRRKLIAAGQWPV